jgi:hypothetical protein
MTRVPEVIVIGESDADVRIAIDLATRVLAGEPKLLDGYLTWSGLIPGSCGSHWQDIRHILDQAQKQGIRLPRYLSRSSSAPLKADGAVTKKILNLIDRLQRQRDIAAVIFIRDLDDQPERRDGLKQARQEHGNPSLAIVIGTADRNREAWVLNGFEAQDAQEKRVLENIAKDLKFDPCLDAHRLRSTAKTDPDRRRNPKHVLEQLTGGDHDREQRCWQETDLDVLRKLGTKTGLTDYLAEVKERLSPMIN